MKRQDNRYRSPGIVHLAIIFVLVVIGIIGVIGWRLFADNNSSVSSSKSLGEPVRSSTISSSVPESIETADEIQQAIKLTDDTALDVDLDESNLDSDIESLQ